MARPRKSDKQPDAPEHLRAAFWKLLEHHDVADISVRMLCEESGYNRGTFYYHYGDRDAFVADVIEQDVLRTAYPKMVFDLLAGTGETSVSELLTSEHVDRVALFVQRGGEVLRQDIRAYALAMWETVLSPDGDGITDEARAIIEYSVGGMLNMLTYMGIRSFEGHALAPPTMFLSQISGPVLGCLAEAQGINREELASRLAVVSKVTRLVEGR